MYHIESFGWPQVGTLEIVEQFGLISIMNHPSPPTGISPIEVIVLDRDVNIGHFS